MGINQIGSLTPTSVIPPFIPQEVVGEQTEEVTKSTGSQNYEDLYTQPVSRPEIPNSLSGAFKYLNDVHHNAVARNMDLLQRELSDAMETYQELTKLHRENREKLAEAAEFEESWKTANRWLSYIVSGASSVIGYCLTASPDPTYQTLGRILSLSGGLELINQLLSHTGAWENFASFFTDSAKDQKELASQMEFATSIVSKVLFFAISSYAYSQGQLANFDSLKMLNIAETLAQSFLMLGQTYANRQTNRLHEEGAMGMHDHHKVKKEIGAHTRKIKETMEGLNRSLEQSRKSFEALNRMHSINLT